MRIKNLLGGNSTRFFPFPLTFFQDFFNENDPVKTINLREGIKHFIVVTGDEATNAIYIRQYELTVNLMDIIDGKTDFVSDFFV